MRVACSVAPAVDEPVGQSVQQGCAALIVREPGVGLSLRVVEAMCLAVRGRSLPRSPALASGGSTRTGSGARQAEVGRFARAFRGYDAGTARLGDGDGGDRRRSAPVGGSTPATGAPAVVGAGARVCRRRRRLHRRSQVRQGREQPRVAGRACDLLAQQRFGTSRLAELPIGRGEMQRHRRVVGSQAARALELASARSRSPRCIDSRPFCRCG